MPIKKTIEKDSTEIPSTTKKLGSVFFFFSKFHRDEVTANLKKNADYDFKQVAAKLGEMWRAQTEAQKSE